jgi:hypothetical protein
MIESEMGMEQWDDLCPHCGGELVKMGVIDIRAGFAEFDTCPKCNVVFRLSVQEVATIQPGRLVNINALEDLLNGKTRKRH